MFWSIEPFSFFTNPENSFSNFELVSIDFSEILGDFFDLVGNAFLNPPSQSGFVTPYYDDPSSNLYKGHLMFGRRSKVNSNKYSIIEIYLLY